ncbi:hypothetical protein TWF694_003877 [Orbilia ellipsospora]|uniref:Amino acid transporter n=1 Tax=Orbilia ellipsospora TaxID=2528407 RepID=A0AAV9WZG9_9PEZI
MSLYLEYGVRWPLTGGELHYIDRVWTYPEKLLTYLYSVTFVLLAGSYGNALVFGSSLIKAATPEGTPVDRRLQKFLSIVLIGFICIWQSYSRLNYILFSDLFALYKIILLATITIMGWLALAGVRAHAADHYGGQYGVKNLSGDFSSGEYTPYGIAIALLQIFRVFTGWENVNYVLEEVQRPPNDPNRVYRRGIKVTIILVTFFYLMVNLAFFATSTTEEIIAAGDTLQLFFNKMFGPSPKSRVASGVLLCLSSTGNVMSATYTNVRVKQEIARMGLIPMPEFWARSTRYDTPGPALFLHWLFSTIVIILTPLDDPNGYLIVSTLFNYSRTVIEGRITPPKLLKYNRSY